MKETLHIYTRVSTDAQEEKGTSLESQATLGIEYAAANGFKAQIWNEGSASSSTSFTNRSVLVRLLNEVADGNIQHIYVWNTDRLSRDRLSSAIIHDKLTKSGVTLHTKSGARDLTDSHDKLLLDILGSIATFDNELRYERFRLGKLSKIRSGYWHGGAALYGYDLVADGTGSNKLAVNKLQAKWVKKIYSLYNKGMSADRIREVLLQNNVTTSRGNAIWSEGSVNKLLSNTHYMGYYIYTDKKSGDEIKVKCDSIISAKTYQTYLKIKKSREKTRGTGVYGGRKEISLLEDIGYCGGCGKKLTTGSNKSSRYYCCRGYWRKYRSTLVDEKLCKSKRTMRLDIADKLIWETVLDVLTTSHLYKETVKQALLPQEATNSQRNKERNSAERRIKRLDKELSKIDAAIVSQMSQKALIADTSRIDKVIKQLHSKELDLKSEKENIQSTLDKVNSTNQWIDWVKAFGDKIEHLKTSHDMSAQQKNDFLKGVVESIEIKEKDKITHRIAIKFTQAFVDDSLEWIDSKKKSEGYKLRKGKLIKEVTGELSLKKNKQEQHK